MDKNIINRLGFLDELAYDLHVLNRNCVRYRNKQTEEMAKSITSSLMLVNTKMPYTIEILKSTSDVLSESISEIIEKSIPLMDIKNDTPLTVKSLADSAVFGDNKREWYRIELETLRINITSKPLSTFTINGIVNIELPLLKDILSRLKIFFVDYVAKFRQYINGNLISISQSISMKKEIPTVLTPLLPSEAWLMDIIENDLKVIKNMFLALFTDIETAQVLVTRILEDMDERILQ